MPMVRVSNGGTTEFTAYPRALASSPQTISTDVGDYILAMTYSSNAQAYGVSATGATLISDISSSNSYYMRIYQATGTSVTISTTVTSGGVGIFKVS